MIKEVNVRQIYIEIARRHGLNIKDVERAATSQFSFVVMIMRKGDFEGIRLPYFGRFWAKPRRKLELDLSKKRRDEREAAK